jgi:two-component system, NtrC family, sensor kinase
LYKNFLINKKVLLIHQDEKKLKELSSFLENIKEFKIDTYVSSDFNESLLISKNFKPDLVVSPYSFKDKKTALDFFKELDESVIRLLFSVDLSFEELQSVVNKGQVFKFLDEQDYSNLKDTIIDSLEYSTLLSQNKFLQEKKKSQVSKIDNLKNKIEEKKLYKNKKNIKLKTQFLDQGVSFINDMFLSFQNILNFKELEDLILNKLKNLINLSFVSINLKTSYIKSKKKEELVLPLFSYDKVIGSIEYLKDEGSFFNKEEIDFLDQVSDTVASICEELINQKKIKELKENWDFIFNSIKSPVVVLDNNFNILKENNTFSENKMFFLRKINKIIKDLNLPSVLKENKAKTMDFSFESKTYNISAYPFSENDFIKFVVLFFKDISEQKTYEDKIFYSEKLAELGIVSGSLAHEINNPIGGILMLLTMMIEDVSKDEKIYEDLVEMRKAAKRCKNIAENLLGFSRRSRDEDLKPFCINKIFEAILPLINMKVKNKGIDILIHDESKNAKVECVFNELLQAILNLVNIYINKIISKNRKDNVKLKSYIDEDKVFIDVLTGCKEKLISKNNLNDLNYFISKKIIESYKGDIFYSFKKEQGNLFKISFPLIK